MDIVTTNIQKGKKEGLYSSSVNEHIMARMYNHKIDMCFNGQIFPANQFSFPDVFFTFISHHMRGMATSKGIELIEKISEKQYK